MMDKEDINMLLNIFLILVLSTLLFYVWRNVELIKKLGDNYCKLCELKTGAKCLKYLP